MSLMRLETHLLSSSILAGLINWKNHLKGINYIENTFLLLYLLDGHITRVDDMIT